MKVTLVRLAWMAWLAWLLTLIVMAWLSYWRVFHASCVYMAIPMAVQALCTIGVLGGGIWRAIRGPRRWNAVTWMLFGILPALWMGALVEYAIRFSSGRNHRPNPLLRWAEGGSSILVEPYVRVFYPHRYEGQRFVMWSNSPQPDQAEMDAMDAHIRDMEQTFGRRSDYKVYWVRGPVLGISGRYGYGWALGERLGFPTDGVGKLQVLDRHEVAHFVLDQVLPRGNEVPKLLHEGWAELHSGWVQEDSREQVWLTQREGKLYSLRELIGPQLYWNSEPSVYWQGCVLVEYLLRQFGHEKFLELCTTCREATFPEDVQRVLGLSLDELDQAYQQDLAGQASPDKRFLTSLRLEEGVDPQRWQRFADDYCAGAERLRTPFRQASVTIVETNDRTDEDGNTTTESHRSEYYHDDHQQVSIRTGEPSGWVSVKSVTPDVQFALHKDDADQPWQLVYYFNRDSRSIFSRAKPYLDLPLKPLSPLSREQAITITEMGANDSTSRLVRISFEDAAHGKPSYRGWWELDPERDYGLVAAEYEYLDAQGARIYSKHMTVEYETIDGHHVPKVACEELLHSRGASRSTYEIESCQFKAPPRKVSELASYGGLRPPESAKEPASSLGILAWIASGGSLLGAGLMLTSVCRRCRQPSFPNS